MDSNKLTDLIGVFQSFCEERDWDQFHNPKDLSIGLITEASELLEHFRFLSEEDARDKLAAGKTREEISDELADIFFFLLRFCQMYDIDLGNALKCKIAKNNRKYPVEKAKGSNRKYTDL